MSEVSLLANSVSANDTDEKIGREGDVIEILFLLDTFNSLLCVRLSTTWCATKLGSGTSKVIICIHSPTSIFLYNTHIT